MQGGFLTTGPPGKSLDYFILSYVFIIFSIYEEQVLGLLTSEASLVVGHWQALEWLRFAGSRTQAQQLWQRGLIAPGIWNLPGPGIEPLSPALAGRFFTTEPPG